MSDILLKKPLGKLNIIEFLRLGKSCSGQRGCFAVNSLRESAILPTKAKELIQNHLQKVRVQLAENIAATKYSGDPESCADLILTFNAGICVEMNGNKSSPDDKIQAFLELLRL